MGRDEERTLAQLKAFRKALIGPTIAEHRGRIVKTTGGVRRCGRCSAVSGGSLAQHG
jgi:adenylate cyclase